MRLVIAVIAALSMADMVASAGETNQAVWILREAKAAMGGDAWNKVRIWHERGNARLADGTAGTYDSYYDFVQHRFHDARREGGSTKLTIFDGAVFWFFTNSHLDRTESSSEMKKVGREGAYMNTYGFFFPERFPAAVRLKGIEQEGHSRFDILEVTPLDLRSIEIWIDRTTHLINRYVVDRGTTITRLADYRHAGDLFVPFESESAGLVTRTESIDFEPENRGLFKPSR